MTKMEMFVALKTMAEEAGREDLVEKINHEIELLDNKKSGTRKETKVQKINKVLDERIMAVLESNGAPMRASEVLAMVDYSDIEGLDNVTLPKITNRLTALCKDAKRVDRFEDKHGVTFAVGTGVGAKVKPNAEE